MSHGGFPPAAHESITRVGKPRGSRFPATELRASPAPLLLAPLPGAVLWPPRPPPDPLVSLADKQYVGKPAPGHTVQWEMRLPGAEGSGRPRPSLLAWGVALSSHPPGEACADQQTEVSLFDLHPTKENLRKHEEEEDGSSAEGPPWRVTFLLVRGAALVRVHMASGSICP